MTAFILSVIIMMICSSVGFYLLRPIRVHAATLDDLGQLEHFIYTTAVGILALISIVFLLGLVGFLYRGVLIGILVCLGIVTFQRTKVVCSQLYSSISRWCWASYSLFEKILLLCFGMWAIAYLLTALSPPTYGDALPYLFPFAQTYIRHHQIFCIPQLFAMRPKNMTMLYVVGFLLHGELLAQMFNYWLTLLTGVSIYAIARRHVAREYALLGAAIFYTMPLAGIVSGNGSSEPGVALYGFLAFCAFISWWKTFQNRWIAISGLLSGACMGFKIIGTEIPLLIGMFVVLRVIWNTLFREASPEKGDLFNRMIVPIVVFGMTCGLTGLPWYYLTYQWTGTPLYSGENVEQLFKQYVTDVQGRSIETIPEEVLATPGSPGSPPVKKNAAGFIAKLPFSRYLQRAFDLLFRFGPKKLAQHAWQMSMHKGHQKHGISPLYLAFIPFLLVFRLTDKCRLLYVFAIFGVLYFTVGVNLWGDYTRYIIPLWPIFSVVVAGILQSIQTKYSKIGNWYKIICIAAILLYFPSVLHSSINHAPVALGFITRDTYLSRHFPGTFAVAQYVNRNLPKTAQLLFIGESRKFLFERDFVQVGSLGLLMQSHHFANPEIAYKRLKLLEITHIILHQQTQDNNVGYRDTNGYVENFKAQYLEFIYQDGDVCLYSLKE